ncbi:MAG: hypothetical protein QOI83_1596 [Streptomycetaceae bacterium]|nr:hypothetical protein [Streptomycetaceae bacterium]
MRRWSRRGNSARGCWLSPSWTRAGHPQVLKREDNAGILRPGIAHAKAWGAVGLGVGGGHLSQHAKNTPVFFSALAAISEGRVASPRPGAGC